MSDAPPPAAQVMADVEMDAAETVALQNEAWLAFSVKYGKTSLSVRFAESDQVYELKTILFSLTDVPPERQKLLGLSRGKLPLDTATLASLSIPPASIKGNNEAGEKVVSITLIGTPLADTFKDPSGHSASGQDTTDASGDVDYAAEPSSSKAGAKAVAPADDPKNKANLAKTIARLGDFPIINAPREGKGLLVLDLDYTIADTKRLLDPLSLPSESARPGLHEFLAAVYPWFDLVIWSQTSWRWLEAKLTELNMLAHEKYKISFVIDRTPMFSVETYSRGQRRKHEVKALQFIWARFPSFYGPHNTLHVDDLSRNFCLNPRSGLKIKPYKNSPCFDTELQALTRYCLQLAHPNVTHFDQADPLGEGGHARWKSCQLPLVTDVVPAVASTSSNGEASASSAGANGAPPAEQQGDEGSSSSANADGTSNDGPNDS